MLLVGTIHPGRADYFPLEARIPEGARQASGLVREVAPEDEAGPVMEHYLVRLAGERKVPVSAVDSVKLQMNLLRSLLLAYPAAMLEEAMDEFESGELQREVLLKRRDIGMADKFAARGLNVERSY